MKVMKLAILVGGSDLFSGLRGISKGTKIIEATIKGHFDKVITVNYNYFLDGGKTLKLLNKYLETLIAPHHITLYGYSKGGDVVLQLARLVESQKIINLLITIDIANGPWSKKINRQVPNNVRKNINIFQSTPSFPLYSYGMAAYSSNNNVVQNVEVTNTYINGLKVNHSNIEILLVPQVIDWIMA